jgi:hypothetical protein
MERKENKKQEYPEQLIAIAPEYNWTSSDRIVLKHLARAIDEYESRRSQNNKAANKPDLSNKI